MVVGETVLVYDQQYRYLHTDVEAETDKAMLVGGVWLPKSQMRYVEPQVYGVPEWLVDENLDFFTHDGKYSERRVKVLDIRDTMRSDAKTRAQQQLRAWARPKMDEDFLGV